MTLNVSVPDAAGAMVDLQVIYYETSGFEYIQGGDKCFPDPDDQDDITDEAFPDRNEMYRALAQATCTSDEISDGASFVLHAESDEDASESKKQLALKETGRFTGIFQGELRLTDADGSGNNGDRINWGLAKQNGVYTEKRGDADGEGESYVGAIIGVGDGPVTITYKDTDGNNKTYDIQIDIQPPTITVDSPVHDGRSDDEKPSFIGSLNDNDSGLAADSFQLDVDNTDDRGDATPVIMVDSGVGGPGEPPGNEYAQVRRRLDYSGFDSTNTDLSLNQFGVISVGDDIYKVENELVTGEMVHKSLEADDFADGAADGEFNEEIEIDFDEYLDSDNTDFVAFNNAVDFQALVRDLAGNVGFSDSDPVNPRFIDDLGADDADGTDKDADRKKGPKKHNVLGVFSRHVVHIDDLDPVIDMDASVTGFYGLNDDDKLIRDRSAVMVVFDNSVNDELIDTGTFALQHDEDTAIAIEDVVVKGKLVFLKLGEELASDATPTLSIAEGREVEDLAGNLLTWQEEDAEAFELNDGILPVFTVILSGGSGTGVGSESPSRLTKSAIDIAIESDEDVNGSPKVAVVCSDIQWIDGENTKKLADYVGNRTGVNETDNREDLTCGPDNSKDMRSASSLARPGNNWVYAWRNASVDLRRLEDGQLEVVVWGRDRSTYEGHDSDVCVNENDATTACENWGSETSTFVLDNTFNSPLNKDGSGGSVQPEADSEVKEPRPFVYLDFAGENTSVTVTKLSVDDEDVLGDLSSVGDNRFLYWPEALAFGTHTVVFDASDAADNQLEDQSFEFDVTARDPFVIDLTAGWNAVSVPANPIDTALDAVFTEEAVDRVVGWNPLSSTGPWSIATRIDGVWTTSANFAPLTDIVVRYGYWVHSMAFVKQSVALKGQLDRESGDNPDPVGIITVPGWNFVGVVDQDGDQTEDHFGKDLKDSEDALVTADDYMPGFRQAYTWDAIANGYRVLDGGKAMKIGKGIWVFFPDDTTLAP